LIDVSTSRPNEHNGAEYDPLCMTSWAIAFDNAKKQSDNKESFRLHLAG